MITISIAGKNVQARGFDCGSENEALENDVYEAMHEPGRGGAFRSLEDFEDAAEKCASEYANSWPGAHLELVG